MLAAALVVAGMIGCADEQAPSIKWKKTATLPADFPKDVPIYAGAQIVSAATTGGTVGAVLSTADTPELVTDFYKSELEKSGWAKPQAVNAAGTSTMTATKEKRRVSVGITKGADGKTSISIGVTAMP
jgi:hypothetical protein